MVEASSILLGLLGIFVSVATFLISYKQTIGARKERARNVIGEINKTLYRNLILEEFVPSLEDLNRMLSSKILECRIKEGDLPAEIDFLNALYTRLIEDELIETNIKDKLIAKIDEKIKSEIKNLFLEEPTEKKSDRDKYFLSSSALLSLFMGMMVFIVSFYRFGIPSPDLGGVMIILTMLVFMIMALVITQNILRQKNQETQEISPTKSRIKEMIDFESSVYKKIKNSGFKNIKKSILLGDNNGRIVVDFYAEKNKTAYYFEVKNLKSIAPSLVLQKLKQISDEIKKTDKKSKLILITRGKIINQKGQLDNWDYLIDEASLDKLNNI